MHYHLTICIYNEEIVTNNITGEVLLTMTKEDWKDIGVKALGDVRILTMRVADLPH